MKIVKIDMQDMLIERSIFRYGDFLFQGEQKGILQASMKDSGIVSPITVYEDRDNRYHLVDGWKRADFALTNKINTLEAVVLPATASTEEIIELIFSNEEHTVKSSTMNQIGFVCFALFLEAGESWIRDHLCIPVGLKPHRGFLAECKRMYDLPAELKRFCHEKRLSLRQITNLSYYPVDVIDKVLGWKSSIHLTASVMDEIISRIRDYLKVSGKELEDFLSESDVKKVFDDDLNIRDRTEKFRSLLRKKKFPILTEVNSRIQKNIDDLNLPEGVSINWDRTLENKGLDITINVYDPVQWPDIANNLGSDSINEAVKRILDEL